MKSAFCGACIRVTAELVLRGQHWLCAACDPDSDEPLPVGVTTGRGYEVPDHDYTATIHAIARDAPGGITTHDRSVGRAATPGFVLVRVNRRRGDRSIDRDEARETLSGNSWFAELRHVSSDPRWHLFERPDVEAAAAERRRAGEFDVAAGLTELARGGR